MGKGDKKSKKGKIFMGSYGNSRMRKNNINVVAVATPKKEKKVEKKAKKA